MRSKGYWIICCIALILIILTFTPLVIPAGTYRPMLLGLPYSLWLGILISIGLVALTFIATRIHHQRESERKK
jgi:uncharacterized membrane protein